MGWTVWTVLAVVVAAALQSRWRAERVRLEHADDADREQRRAARIAAWALRLDDAIHDLERAVGDPDTRAARDKLERLRAAAPEELRHEHKNRLRPGL